MRPIYVFKAMTMIGMKDHNGQWWKVTTDCIRCGQCCAEYDPFTKVPERCQYLKQEDTGKYLCGLKGRRPFNCCCSSPYTKPEYCSVEMEKTEQPEFLLE